MPWSKTRTAASKHINVWLACNRTLFSSFCPAPNRKLDLALYAQHAADFVASRNQASFLQRNPQNSHHAASDSFSRCALASAFSHHHCYLKDFLYLQLTFPSADIYKHHANRIKSSPSSACACVSLPFPLVGLDVRLYRRSIYFKSPQFQ